MLRVLGSSGKKFEALDGVKHESKVTDNLENLFSEVMDFKSYWNKLTGDNCPILFYYLSMEDYGLYDD